MSFRQEGWKVKESSISPDHTDHALRPLEVSKIDEPLNCLKAEDDLLARAFPFFLNVQNNLRSGCMVFFRRWRLAS